MAVNPPNSTLMAVQFFNEVEVKVLWVPDCRTNLLVNLTLLFFAHHIVEYPVIEAASYSKSYSVLEKIDFELWHIFTAYVD